MNSRLFQFITVGLLAISIILTGVSLMPKMDWAKFDRTSGVGPIDYTLKADFDAIGFEYSLATKSSEGGGGIIGGIGGGIGDNFSKVEEWKTYPEVKGEVLENLGVLYDSYKDKSYKYELLMREPPQEAGISWEGSGSPSAILNVSLKADLVPFWPASGSRPLDVKVTFMGSELAEYLPEGFNDQMVITLNKITIKAKTGYNEETSEYEGKDRTLKTVELSEDLVNVGDEYSSSIDVSFPEGEDSAGFIVEIDASMIDHWGRAERSPLSGQANPINIRSVENVNILRSIGIPLSLPLLVISILLSITAIVLILIRKKSCPGLVIPAGLFAILGPLWYWNGMNAAIELLSQRLAGAQDGLHWSGGFFLAIIGAIAILLAIGITIVDILITRKENKDEDKKKVEETSPKFRQTTEPPSFRRVTDPDPSKGKVTTPVQPASRAPSPPPPPIDPIN